MIRVLHDCFVRKFASQCRCPLQVLENAAVRVWGCACLADFLVKAVGTNLEGVAASLRSVLELIELCREPALQLHLLLQHEEILKRAALVMIELSIFSCFHIITCQMALFSLQE